MKRKKAYVGELVSAEEEHRLVGLEAQDLRLNKRDRNAVHLDEASALLDEGNSGGGFLQKFINFETFQYLPTKQQLTFLPKVCTLSTLSDILSVSKGLVYGLSWLARRARPHRFGSC